MAKRSKVEKTEPPQAETSVSCLFPKCAAAGKCLGHFGYDFPQALEVKPAAKARTATR